MKKTIWGLALLLGLASCSGNKSDNEMDAFINDLMGKMTLEEKLGQLNLPVTGDIVTGAAQSSNVAENIRAGRVGGLFNLKGAGRVAELQRIAVEESRLGIPLIFGMDVIHGYETVFPIPLGLSCTWDMEAIERSAQIAAQEATADGICWTFSPMVDICHDARWGRISEGNGEDPFLGSRIAEAMVRGYQQGDLTSANTMMACVKHFALYGAPEAGRDYNTVDMSLWRMYNEYFPPYKAACDAGAGSYMASFNIVNGVPATGNRWLLTDVLRKQWGFDGFVVSDYTGIYEMIAHGMGDLKEVSALALHAGLDMDMVSDGLVGTLAESLKDAPGKLPFKNTVYRQFGKIPREVHVEYYGLDGTQILNQDAQFSLMGDFSLDMPQKSMKFRAKSLYGAKTFAAPLFDDLPFQEYKSFVLRNSGNDCMFSRLADGFIGFVDIPGHQTQMAEAGAFPVRCFRLRSVREKLQVLSRSKVQVNRSDGAVLPRHAEGLRQPQHFPVKPGGFLDIPCAQGRVGQPADDG